MEAPVEPWVRFLRMLMIVSGLLLLISFVAPWSVGGGKTRFLWSNFGTLPTNAKIIALMVAGTGFLSTLMGALPLPTAGRGLGAALLAFGGLVFAQLAFNGVTGLTAGSAGDLNVFGLVTLLGGIALVSGLVLRSQYRGSLAPRLIATVGALLIVATYLIPQGSLGDKMLLMTLVDGIADLPGRQKVSPIVELLPLVLALISVLVWIPGPTSVGASAIGWLWILLPLFLITLPLLVMGADEPGALFKARLGELFWLPAIMVAWTSLIAYGVATLVGKQLEHI